jgi:hypothetical protein
VPAGTIATATTAQKATKLAIPASIPRSSPSTASAPRRRCVKTASTEASAGSADSTPPGTGPRILAASVNERTSTKVSAIRSGISPRADRPVTATGAASGPLGIADQASASESVAPTSATSSGVLAVVSATGAPHAAAISQPAARLVCQPARVATQA